MARGKARVGGSLPMAPPAGLRVDTLTHGDEALLIASYPLDEPRLPETLSRAEREVVAAVLRGRTNAEIAVERGSSARTVANLLARAFRKLGVCSRAELAARLASDGDS
jgi:DNA-binding CsgD family transcriptional regulator